MKQYQDKDWLYRKYWDEKLSLSQIAELCGTYRTTIAYWMKKFNIKVRIGNEGRYKDGLHQDGDWLRQKYVIEKKSSYEIANICKCDGQTILNWLKKHGIKTRTKSEEAKKRWANPEYRERTARAIAESKNRPEWKKGKSKAMKALWLNPEYRKKAIEAMKVAKNCPEAKKRASKIAKEVMSRPGIRKKISDGTKIGQNRSGVRRRMSELAKIRQNHPEAKKRNSERMEKFWQDPEYVENILKAINKRPTNPEKVFDEMTSNVVRYTGNRAWWRKLPNGKYKNPDFKITGQNKVIEIFGDYWHKGEDPQELMGLYKQVGLDCLIFWEHEVYNQQEMVLERVDQFISQ